MGEKVGESNRLAFESMGRLEPEIVTCTGTELFLGYEDFIRSYIDRETVTHVCDLGGGRKPLLDVHDIDGAEIDYTMVDISQRELDLAPPHFRKICADAAGTDFAISEEFDLVFSKMLVEHIADGPQLHRNVFRSLKPGGYAIHFFPTLLTLPFLANAVIPERLSNALLDLVAPRERVVEEKFPAYYRSTWGPTNRQLAFFREFGYEVESYHAGFGHAYYNRIRPLKWIAEQWWTMASARKYYLFTTYAVVVLRKPQK